MLINKHLNDLKSSEMSAAITTTERPTIKNVNSSSSSMNKRKNNNPTPTMTITTTPSTLSAVRIQNHGQPQQQQQRHHQKSSSTSSFLSSRSSLALLPSLHKQRNLLIGFILTILYIQHGHCADLAISIPNNQGMDGAFYRLDYSPPYGYPEPNATIASNEIGDEIQFSRALPGTKYNFWLYYTNGTHRDWLTWTVSITTAPDPPSNLSVQVRSSKNAIIQWSPPTQGNYTAFKIKVLGLSEASSSYNRVFNVNDSTFQHSAKELTPGATYQVQAYTIYDGKESVAYTSRNFTTIRRTRHKDLLDIKILRGKQ